MKRVNLTYFLLGLLLFACNQADSSGNGSSHTYAAPEMIRSASQDSVSPYGPTRMVRNIKQARNGDILIASLSAVWQYDGKLFTNISSSIPAPSFWDVLEDRNGNLWFGSRDSGVYLYQAKSLPGGEKGFQHFTTKNGLPGNAALHIYEDKAGHIWFGTGAGLSRYDGKSFRNFTTADGLPNNDINTILEDKTGKLWIGTRGEAAYYDGKTFASFSHEGKTFNNVWAIIEDKKGNIWLSDNTGLWRFDGSSFTRVSERPAAAILEDKNGNIWTTVSENDYVIDAWTLTRYDQKTLYDKNPAVTTILSKQKMLSMLMEANDGSIWIGAMNGLFRYDGKSITDFKNKEGK